METLIPFELLDQANISAYQLNIKNKEIYLNNTLATQTGLSRNKTIFSHRLKTNHVLKKPFEIK